eukprot:GHRQ01030911.1.p1 GENE.GHRQ01030911.1~~GHRQ01030911.1.p1  ORF type:complete len:225 (+),score=63.93 GHRQ01030911.1:3-677(+)
MVEVVNHCHELGVMHRDLKPENFLLTGKGADAELKLTDFGLSVFFKHNERFRDLVGSPYYVAPEVLRKNYSYEADMWSLGVILYILLSGLPPFWGDTEDQIFKMVLKGAIDFKSEPWPKISDAAKDCVKQLLEMDPAKRATSEQVGCAATDLAVAASAFACGACRSARQRVFLLMVGRCQPRAFGCPHTVDFTCCLLLLLPLPYSLPLLPIVRFSVLQFVCRWC